MPSPQRATRRPRAPDDDDEDYDPQLDRQRQRRHCERRTRNRESSEASTSRNIRRTDSQASRRASEPPQITSVRRTSDAAAHALRRSSQTPAERTQTRSSNAAAQRRSRAGPVNLQLALHSRQVNPHYLGALTKICLHCGARHFTSEQVARHPNAYVDCCHFGRIVLDKFHNFPPFLKKLFLRDPNDRTLPQNLITNFHGFIRNYNSALAMASLGAQISLPPGRGPYCFRIHGQIYHNISSLHPVEGEPRQYGQIYILDTQTASEERARLPHNSRCDPELLRRLGRLITELNPYAESYKMMADIERAEISAAEQESRQPLTLTMVFNDAEGGGIQNRRYDIPIANEVAVVYVGEDGDVPPTRSIQVRNTRGEISNISYLKKECDPLTYPLLFPTGADGWEPALRDTLGNRITQKQFYSYLFAIRDSFNPILYGGKLFQQYAVDAFVKIEQNRLNYHRQNQGSLRADSYRGIQEYLADDSQRSAGPTGRRIVLPSTYIGSPRHMQQCYQDAMAIVSLYGKPDIFMTITCNPQWKEIQDNLYPGQKAIDRPDLTTKVFKHKLKEIFDDILRKHVFGEVVAYIMVIEFQKRGLPHCHTLLILKQPHKPTTPEIVDMICSGEIPNKLTEPALHEAVTKFMLHRKCGPCNAHAPCMKNEKCSKRFPKELRSQTSVANDGYPHLRRRQQHTAEHQGQEYDDQWVVPYNPFFLLKYACHINVEICGMISSVKYLYKYCYKGTDRALIEVTATQNDIDEIKNHLNARYVCAPEALHRILGYELQDKSHTVQRLAIHLPDDQRVIFEQGHEEQALNSPTSRTTTLTSFFLLNSRHNPSISDAIPVHDLYYNQFPQYFTYTSQRGWQPRQRASKKIIGRMYTVSPRDTERYALRLLLLATRGAKSFQDLKRVDGTIHSTFMDAAKAAGLLHDDIYFRNSLREAATFQTPRALRSFFTSLIAFCEVNDAQGLWDEFNDCLAEDYRHQGFTDEISEALAYHDIAARLTALNVNFNQFVPAPTTVIPIPSPTSSEYEDHATRGAAAYTTLNTHQKEAIDNILEALHHRRPACFFIDGPGGSGKTYLYNTLYNIAVGNHQRIQCVAWTGIAANLLPKGRTANSIFKLNISDNNRSSSMTRQQREAKYLADLHMIIWDEVSMVPKGALEAVDSLLRDIFQNETPFGGIIMVLGGDFRQTLPIVERGTSLDTVDACITRSNLWPRFTVFRLQENVRARGADAEWQTFLLQIGSGETNNSDGRVTIPAEYMCEGDIVDEVYGEIIEPNDTDELADKAILAPTNASVFQINENILDRLTIRNTSDEKTYNSIDEIVEDEDRGPDFIPTEYLHAQTPTGMPPHELHLKKGTIVMLLRNLDVTNGLCNGTRLKVVHLGPHTLGCEFINGNMKGHLAIIPRIANYCESRLPFRFKRRQFPIRIAFAMTINKSQGQTFTKVGLHLDREVFSHGQLYVALSRVRRPDQLRIKATRNPIKNVVFPNITHT